MRWCDGLGLGTMLDVLAPRFEPAHGRSVSRSVLVVAFVVLASGCSAALPAAAPDASTVGPRVSIDDRLVAAAQPLLPSYSYGGVTNTAEAVCDSFQGGTSWVQEVQTLAGLRMTPPDAAAFMEISIASYCRTTWQLIPVTTPYQAGTVR